MSEHVKHPLIVPGSVESRTYQLTLAKSALKDSSMIVLPTGLGKTIVALLVIANRLERGGRVLFLAPTKPLVEQHTEFLRSHLRAETIIFTGEIPPHKRSELWTNAAQVVVSTPQVIENDLAEEKIDLSQVALVIFDEAHRAVGNYSYVYIANKYVDQAKDPLILGLTASPGGTIEKIQRVSDGLHINNIEIRTETDPDVLPYIYEKYVEWYKFSLPPEMDFIRQSLNSALSSRLRELKIMGIISKEWVSTSELLRLRTEVSGSKNYRAMSVIAEVIKLRHAIGMIETQGVVTTNKYFERLKKEAKAKGGSKAAKRLVSDPHVKRAMDRAKTLKEMHPKLLAVENVVHNLFMTKPDSRIIVFTNYRDTAELVKNALLHIDGVRPVKFVGQAQKDGVKGLSQKQQVQLISEFIEGKYNVLVATSVAEEGLDIPSTDMVLFYEPIPSEIRSIQREGRTGRRRSGKVVVLITKGTRDEAYYWSSNRKRKIMRAEMKRMSDKASDSRNESSFHIDSEPHTIENTLINVQSVNDNQTSDNAVIETQCSYHWEEGAMNSIQITRGGPHVHAVELMAPPEKCQKTLLDFEKGIKDTVGITVDIPEVRSGVVNETIKLVADIEVSPLPIADCVLRDKSAIERKIAEDSLSTLTDHDLFEREQSGKKRGLILRGKKPAKMLKEQQEYLISSIPSIGLIAAGALLKHFGSVEAVINAPEEQLLKVRGIGKITARKIREIISAKYTPDWLKE